MNAMNVLIVDDDVTVQQLIALALQRQHIACDRVSCAEDALMLLTEVEYTGLIIDLALPGMDGWTLLEMIRRNPRTAALPCVAITCYDSDGVADETIGAGFTTYFRKPLDMSVFVQWVQTAFHSSCMRAS